MNKYESVIIIKPNLSEEELNNILKKTEENMNKVAKITETKKIGMKKLAYEIQKCNQGYFVSYEFETENTEKIVDIERFYRIQDEIMKFIVVKKD